MRKPLIVILAIILCLGTFGYFADVKYTTQDGSLSIGGIGVQFARDGQVYRLPPPPYRNQIASVASALAWFKGDQGDPISPNAIGTSSSYYATVFASQRNMFYTKGLFWVFWSDGSNMVYSTSEDGTTWSGPTTVRACSYGYYFSIWFNGTHVFYAYAPRDGRIYYRCGVPNSDGTISWSADEQTILIGSSIDPYLPSIAVDSNGYAWIAYVSYDEDTPWIIKNAKKDGTWATASGFPLELDTSAASWGVEVVPLTGGKVAVVYLTDYSGAEGHVKAWSGSSWLSAVDLPSTSWRYYTFSAVAQGDTVHIVYTEYDTEDIKYARYEYASNSITATATVQAATTAYTVPSITVDPNGGDLYVFWACSPTDNHIYYRKYSESGGWGDVVDWIDESAETIYRDERVLTSFYQAWGNYIGIAYTTSTASPYGVKFACLPVAQQVTYFQIGLSDISVSGEYVKAGPNSALNTANITVRVYHNVDSNSTWVLAGQYTLASEAGLPWSGSTTSPWYELLSGSYAQGNHTYYMKVEVLIQGYDAVTGDPVEKSGYVVLSTTLNWQSVAQQGLQLTETDMVEKVYVPIMVSTINALIMGAAVYLARRERD